MSKALKMIQAALDSPQHRAKRPKASMGRERHIERALRSATKWGDDVTMPDGRRHNDYGHTYARWLNLAGFDSPSPTRYKAWVKGVDPTGTLPAELRRSR